MTENTNPIRPLAVSKKVAADMLGLSVRGIENYLRTKRIVARKAGRRTLVLVSSLENFLRHDQPSASDECEKRP